MKLLKVVMVEVEDMRAIVPGFAVRDSRLATRGSRESELRTGKWRLGTGNYSSANSASTIAGGAEAANFKASTKA